MNRGILLVMMFCFLCSPQLIFIREMSFEGEAHLSCLSDLQGDGSQELIISDRETRRVMCYDLTGSILWAQELDYPIICAAAHDIDHDGIKELFLLEEVTPSEFHTYRVSSVDAEGVVSWRKFIEVSFSMSPHFHFLEVDGEEGDEILIANRIIQGRGFERFEFSRDCMIIGVTRSDTTPFFLMYNLKDEDYELHTLDVEPLWEGIPCRDEKEAEELSALFHEMMVRAGIDCCYEKCRYCKGIPLLKTISYVLDSEEDGIGAQICFTDIQVQVSKPDGGLLWTWDSPDAIKNLFIEDLTGDRCPEVIIETTSDFFGRTALHVLNMRGEYIMTVRLSPSGNLSVHFSDLDGDGDTDLVTLNTSKKSTLAIYSNTCIKGPQDVLPSSAHSQDRNPFHPSLALYILCGVLIGSMISLVLVMKRKRRSQ